LVADALGLEFPRSSFDIGHLARLCEVDKAVLLDLAPLPNRSSDSFVTRNRIWNRTTSSSQWLTVPVLRNRGQSVRDTAINPTDGRWATRHINALKHCYPRHELVSPGFVRGLEWILLSGHQSLLDLNLQVLQYLLEVLGASRNMPLLQSSLVRLHGPNHRVDVARHLSTTEYIAGSVEWSLLNTPEHLAAFRKAGIRVLGGAPFQLDTDEVRMAFSLSAVHWLCTRGVAATHDLLVSQSRQLAFDTD
jgi:WbqC-like protein family